jgi:hypothetical protein
MTQFITVKVAGEQYVPLSHWQTVVNDRDKWKKMYEELASSIAGGPTADRVAKLHDEIVRLVSDYND